MWKAYYDFFLAGVISWFVGVWLAIAFIMLSRTLLAGVFYYNERKERLRRRRRIRQDDNNYCVTTLVTCAKESRQVFELSMNSLRKQEGLKKHFIYVMIDAADDMDKNDDECHKIAAQYADRIYLTNARSKRHNLANLTKIAEEEGNLYGLLAFMDSDTVCDHKNVLADVCDAFRKPQVGGATTVQRCLRTGNIYERVGDWLEQARLLSSMAAGSLFGQVGCLPGRLYMARTSVVVPKIYDLPKEEWSGWKPSSSFPFIRSWKSVCKAGDDRQITNYILEDGYDTVLVPTAGVKTLVPDSFQLLWRTWLRWATSSQGYVYRTLHWSWKKPFVLYHYLGDIFVTHASVFLVVSWIYSFFMNNEELLYPFSVMVVLSVVGMMLTFFVRQFFHLIRQPRDILILPAFIVIVTLAQFIRLYAHYTPWRIGVWGTRSGIDDEVEETWVKKSDYN